MTQMQPGPAEGRARVAVVGGGACGLAAAWYLARQGHAVELFEAEPELGGRMATQPLGDREVGLGGKNIGRKYRRFREFVAEHGEHRFEQFGVNWSRERGGRLLTLDSTRRLASARNFLSQATPLDALKFGRWLRAVRSDEENRFLRGPYWAAISERKDDRPLAAHVSPRMCESMIRMMTVRMNGAEPDEVYLGTFGSNLGMMDTYDQLVDGFKPVLEEFARRHAIRLRTRVLRPMVAGGRVVGLEFEPERGRSQRERYDAVVIAAPAPAAAAILRPVAAGVADRLERIRYFPSTAVVVEYERDVFSGGIRAIAFDAEHPLSNAGAYGMEDLRTVRYTFSGRAARPLLAEHGADFERLVDIGERQLERHFPVRSARRRRLVGRRWDPSYCAYVPRHGPFLDELDREVERIPGLHLTGDYFRGASIEACFHASEDCAAGVGRALRRRAAAERAPAPEGPEAVATA